MEFNTKEEADAAWARAEHGPNSQEVYAAMTRFYARQFPGDYDPGSNGSTVLPDLIGQAFPEQSYEPPVKLFSTLLNKP